MTAPPPRQLDYAPPPPWHQRRHVGRWFLVLVALLAITGGIKAYPTVQQQLAILYWQRQCLNYSAPAEQVVYEQSKSVSVIPVMCQRFMSALGQGWSTCGTAYMHERSRPDGERRLVFVEVLETYLSIKRANKDNPADVAFFAKRVFLPGTLFRPPAEVPRGLKIVDPREFYFDTESTRVFAGQSDPSNPSHFTIRYATNGRDEIIDGYLHNDDTVTLEVRRPEAAAATK